MIDYFLLFGESRRPWLDPDSLKQKFLAFSANFHPDKIHDANENEKNAAAKNFAELNTAYNCLAESKSRLLHLLELETGEKPEDIRQIPAALADLFAQVAGICKNAGDFLAEKNKNTSPLLQVQFFEEAQNWIERLKFLKKKLGDMQNQLLNELKLLDEKWILSDAKTRAEMLPRLEELYRLFSYFNRWNGQIRERVVQLTL